MTEDKFQPSTEIEKSLEPSGSGGYVLGQGSDALALIAFGALLELILIIANIGTAVVTYSIHKRVSEPRFRT